MKKIYSFTYLAEKLLLVVFILLAFGCKKERICPTIDFSMETGACGNDGGDVIIVVHQGNFTLIDSVPPSPDAPGEQNSGEEYNSQDGASILNSAGKSGREEMNDDSISGELTGKSGQHLSDFISNDMLSSTEAMNPSSSIIVCDDDCTPVRIEICNMRNWSCYSFSLERDPNVFNYTPPCFPFQPGITYRIIVYYKQGLKWNQKCIKKTRYLTILC